MDILKLRGISLFVIAFCLLILALILWQRAEKDKAKIWLGSSAFFRPFTPFLWRNLFFWNTNSIASIYWYRTTWLGVFVLPPFIIFTYYFVQNLKYLKIKAFLLYLWAAIISYFALTTDLIVKFVYFKYPNISSLAGKLDFLGRLYISFCIVLILINLLKEYFKSSGLKKLQLQYFIAGVAIFLITGIIATAIIPAIIGESPYYDITAYASFFWFGLTTMAILKYHFLNIKIITTQLLIFILWTVTLINFITEESFRGYLLTGGSLIFMIIGGILLIRSVIKEIAQREQIEKLSMYKSELLSIVAHQIKNPLIVIKGYISLVDNKVGGGEIDLKDFFQKVKVISGKLLDLLNNLLDLSRIEEDRMHYEFSMFEINKVLKEIVDDFQFIARRKCLDLIFEPVQQSQTELVSEKFWIKGDDLKLSQVFRNLIDNAIKYTDKGWVKVNLQLTTDNQQQNVLITVSDSGKGMPKEIINKLFQKFSRGIEDERILGSGLGLYISKRIIEDHKGKIWAESEGRDKGSKFIVLLPEFKEE